MSRSTIMIVVLTVIFLLGLAWYQWGQDQPTATPGDEVEAASDGETQAGGEEDAAPASSREAAPDSGPSSSQPPSEEADEKETAAAVAGEDGMAEPDWRSVSDVDALASELEAAHEDGDPNAAYYLHALSLQCGQAASGLESYRELLEETHSPERRQQLQDRLDRLSALEEPCSESRFNNPTHAMESTGNWLWRAAEEGHPDALYETVFGTWGSGSMPADMEQGDEAARDRLRQEYAEQLREDCHAEGLHSMGLHLSRDSGVTRGLEMGDFSEAGDETARQMEGFAHRYAAARIRGESRPAHSARHADHALTSAEERQARSLAERILQGCD